MAEFPDTRDSLIERVQGRGDETAWLEFWGIYQPVIYRMTRRRGLQDADAQDVIQQVFASVARAIGDWEADPGRSGFRAWLATIARNAITNALSRRPRDRASGSTSIADALHAQTGLEETDSEVIAEARRELVHWAADQVRGEFTETTWSIFQMTSVDGVEVAKVAELTGRSVGAIYVARHRVLTRLREKVAEVSCHWDVPQVK